MIGRIKTLKPSGYGFIVLDDGTDVFFHYTEYQGDFLHLASISPPNKREGPLVQFIMVEHKRGPRATKVQLIGNI